MHKLTTATESIRRLIPTDSALKEEFVNCTTNTTNAAEIWTAIGTCAAAVFAAIAVIVAFRTSRADKKRHRQQEVRQATAAMIQSIHTLATRSKDTSRDNEADRNETYQQSILFELAAGQNLNRDRFNAAINWIFRASGHRRAAAEALEDRVILNRARRDFIDVLVREMTESLRTYDAHGGEIDPTPDIAQRFEEVFSSEKYHTQREIYVSLAMPGNIYERLTGSKMPAWKTQEPERF